MNMWYVIKCQTAAVELRNINILGGHRILDQRKRNDGLTCLETFAIKDFFHDTSWSTRKGLPLSCLAQNTCRINMSESPGVDIFFGMWDKFGQVGKGSTSMLGSTALKRKWKQLTCYKELDGDQIKETYRRMTNIDLDPQF